MQNNAQITKKIREAQLILSELGLPNAQQNEISALTLLALAGIKPKDLWKNARKPSLTVTKGVMDFIAKEYKRKYAPNTRETVRRQVLHQFLQAGIIDYNPDDPSLATNSPRAHYALTSPALETIRHFGTKQWAGALRKFIDRHGKLKERYGKRRNQKIVPVTLNNGTKLELSPGKHNEVQAAVIHEFIPRFLPGAEVLYLGDTAKKDLFIDVKQLEQLHIPISEHDKLPDLILIDKRKRRIFLIEVITSHGPMTPKRVLELEQMLKNCKLSKIYISAFPNLSQFKSHAVELAWETEVWIANTPDHMIHFNGEKFLGQL